MSEKKYKNFKEFYPYYLSEHKKPLTKLLHFLGSLISLLLIGYFSYKKQFFLLPLAFFQGYIWAWISHFYIEKNRPATFTYPLWSFMGDVIMFFQILRGKHRVY